MGEVRGRYKESVGDRGSQDIEGGVSAGWKESEHFKKNIF